MAETVTDMVDAAIATAREQGCTCTWPDVWLVGLDAAQKAVVVDHDECREVTE